MLQLAVSPVPLRKFGNCGDVRTATAVGIHLAPAKKVEIVKIVEMVDQFKLRVSPLPL